MASDPASNEFEVALQRGVEYFRDRRYNKAAVTFKQLVEKCSCGVLARSSPCVCKSLLPAIEQEALKEELKKLCICSAKSSTRCTQEYHIKALDSLAAVYEQSGQTERAMAVAESMINLNPRDPRGFLRFGKVLSSRGSHQAAYLTYRQGFELVNKKATPHRLLPMLQSVMDKARLRSLASDPLRAIPVEIAAMIFRYLSFATLCRCLRVSKSWNTFLTRSDESIQSLWRVQRYGNPERTWRVSLTALRKYQAYAGRQIREIHIENGTLFLDLGNEKEKLQWIYDAYKTLKAFSIQCGEISMPRYLKSWNNLDGNPMVLNISGLTRLFLGPGTAFHDLLAVDIILKSAQTLQELTLLNLKSADIATMPWPFLERLRILRLGHRLQRLGSADVNIHLITRNTPNLEELWLENITFIGYDFTGERRRPLWPRLKRMYLGSGVFEPVFYDLEPGPFPVPDLEVLLIVDRIQARAVQEVLTAKNSDQSPGPYLAKLRVLGLPDLHVPPLIETGRQPEHFSRYTESLLRPSLESGALEELLLNEYPRILPPWFKSDNVRFLSIAGLNWVIKTELRDDFLSEVVGRFPNATALNIGKVHYSPSALGKVIDRGVIKLIYTQGRFPERLELYDWAKERHGVLFTTAAPPHGRPPAPTSE